MTSDNPLQPTRVRYLVLVATSLVAVSMYLDRACLSQLMDGIQRDLQIEDWQKDWILGAFFWSYALAQVPGGWLGTRLGSARVLAYYLAAWSVFTVAAGLSMGFVGLFVARLATGLAQAGTYPTSASIVRAWYPMASRGRASSVVALGGRLGWMLSQLITPLLLTLAVSFAAGWRLALIEYGVLGLIGAAVYAVIARDSAREHPWSNSAEAALVDPPPPPRAGSVGIPLGLLASSGNLWLSSGLQFGVNLGWVFLITKLPEFLTEAHDVPPEQRGAMAAVPAAVSCVGMFLGGFVTDGLMRRFGLRVGRSLPIGGMMFLCSAAYLIAARLDNPWHVILALSVMGIGVDLSNPALWAFHQDIGGRYVGPALGWGNMWGNFGAALSPVILGVVQRNFGWDVAFLTCAASFAVAGVCGFAMNAEHPLEPREAPHPAANPSIKLG